MGSMWKCISRFVDYKNMSLTDLKKKKMQFMRTVSVKGVYTSERYFLINYQENKIGFSRWRLPND